MREPVDLLLTNGTVVAMDAAGRVFAPGMVAIKDGSIVAVGRADEGKRFEAANVLECAGHIVMPGLVNAHAHLPMTLLRGLVDDLRLDVWLHGYMMPVERQFVTPAFSYLGAQLACLELIRGGVTCFADMYYFEDQVATAAAGAGLRGVCGETVLKFPSPDAASYDDSLAECRRFLAKWKGHPLITPAVAPHAPYTCTAEILRESAALAHEFDVPLEIHLCETRQEVEDWLNQYGCTPIQWVAQQGLFDAWVIAAHCAHVDESDLRLLARSTCGVAHNPTSNLKLASGIAPAPRIQTLGIPLGIGTDGSASNNDQDMFEELRLAALLPKGVLLDPTVTPAQSALSMATLGGARALHLDRQIGSLEVGKRADVIVVGADAPHAVPRYSLSDSNVYAHLVYVAKSHDVRDTIVNGRLLMRNRQILTLDEPAILREAQSYADRIAAFVIARDRNLVDKLIALGEVAREETFEVQVKTQAQDLDAIERRLLAMPTFRIIKHTVRQQYDTYLLFTDPELGRVRYREDSLLPTANQSEPATVCWQTPSTVAPEYRLTWIGPTNEREYANSAILTRSRFDATASRSLRFYKEYFQPARVVEITKHRRRYRVIYRDLEFAINLDRTESPAGAYLEIKSRTWSSRDALRKAELISELLEVLGVPSSAIIHGEYVDIKLTVG